MKNFTLSLVFGFIFTAIAAGAGYGLRAETPEPEILLLKLTLDATTGQPLGMEQIGKPFTDAEKCETARIEKGLQRPKDGKVAVYACAVPLTRI